jgi:hypothetical protein
MKILKHLHEIDLFKMISIAKQKAKDNIELETNTKNNKVLKIPD